MNIRIKDICRFGKKSDIKAGEGNTKGKYMFFTSSIDKDKRIDKFDYDEEGIIMGTGGNATLHYYSGKFAVSTDCLVLLPNSSYKCKYLYYFFLHNMRVLEGGFRGAGLKHTSKSYIENIELTKTHSLLEQDKIISVLSNIDNTIVLQNKRLKLLNELTRSLFIEMFGDLGEDIFGDGLKLLKDVCQINPKKDNYIANIKDFLVSFVPMSAVSESGEIDTTIIKCYDEVKKGFTSFIEDDVLFAKITPCMENGKGAIAKKLKNSVGFGSTEFHVLRPLKDKSNSAWIYYLTSFSHFRKEAEIKMTGSAGQRRVPASFLENYKIALPPLELQNKFANFVRGTDKSKLAVKKSLEELEILKKSLMQKYFA